MPLRQAHPGEEPALLELVTRDPFYNLFLISNLNQGLDEVRTAWVDDAAGGVLMRRAMNWMCDPGPTPTAFDWAAAAAIMDSCPPAQVKGFTGRPETVEALFGRLQNHPGELYQQHFAALESAPAPVTCAGAVRPDTPADLDQAAALYADAGTMTRSREAVAAMNLWVVEVDGEIVSAGAIHAETDQAGMIGAVFTPPRHRGHGYASALVHGMSTHLLAAGRRPCLFFHNPDAGRIYHRLGFRNLGPFAMVHFGTHA